MPSWYSMQYAMRLLIACHLSVVGLRRQTPRLERCNIHFSAAAACCETEIELISSCDEMSLVEPRSC